MEIKVHELGDLPVLYFILSHCGIAQAIDGHYPMHHNRKNAISVGQTVVVWLLYILSENDHRVSYVEEWVEDHLEVIRRLLEVEQLDSKQFSDDYLGSLLDQFEDSARWESYEVTQNSYLIEVYNLPTREVRLDSTTAPSFRPAEGLFQYGYSKQKRSDLPQLKLMLASLDPLGMPIASLGVEGNRADDLLYIDIIEKAQKSLPPKDMLYIGDTKLGTLDNRHFIAMSENHYLCPLSKKYFSQASLEQTAQHMQAHPEQLELVYAVDDVNKEHPLAYVYELASQQVSVPQEQVFTYTERLVLVQSSALAEQQRKSLQERLDKAQQQIRERFDYKRGRKMFTTLIEAQQAADTILKKYNVKDLLQLHFTVSEEKRSQKYPVYCQVEKDQAAITSRENLCGYRIYATNAPIHRLSATELVGYYRKQYRIEQNFHQLFNKVTQLLPIFLQKQERIVGLVRLLILALKISNLTQYQVRQQLQQEEDYLTHIVPGNAGRKVYQPTTARLLHAFAAIRIVQVTHQNQITFSIEPLTEIQVKILNLLKIPLSFYSDLFMSKNFT